MRAAGALLGLGVGLAFVWLDPEAALRPEAALAALQALGAALAVGLGAIGGGSALLQRLAPRLLDDGRGLLHAAVIGLMLHALLGLGLAGLGLFVPLGPSLPSLLLGLGWLSRPPVRAELNRNEALLIGLLGVFVAAGLLPALAPPVDTDELYYQLSLPRQIAETGLLPGGLLRPDGSRPLLLHLPFASAYALGGASAPRLLHLGLAALLLPALGAWGRALGRPAAGGLAALLLVGSYSVLAEGGLAATNLPAAAAVLCVLDAALRGEAIGLALAAGAALGLKYTTAGGVAGAFLVARMPLRQRIIAGVGALLLLTPWWARNALSGLHPLFPYAGWPPPQPGTEFTFVYLEKYGAGRAPLDLALAPLRAVMSAKVTSFRFLGKLSPAWVAAAPLALWGLLRIRGDAARIAIAGAIGLLAWVAGPHWIRHLLPIAPVIALALGLGVEGAAKPAAGRLALGLATLLGLGANLLPLLPALADRVGVVTGQEPQAAFLDRHLDPLPAVRFVNEHTRDDAVVAVFFDWSLFYIERPTLLGSVEDHIPSRDFLLRHGPDSLDALRALGATHVLVRRAGFLQKSYPFLTKAELDRAFRDPEALLGERLLLEGELLFERHGVAVWKISP